MLRANIHQGREDKTDWKKWIEKNEKDKKKNIYIQAIYIF